MHADDSWLGDEERVLRRVQPDHFDTATQMVDPRAFHPSRDHDPRGISVW